MSLFEKLFPRPQPKLKEQGFFKLLNGYTPVFHSFGGMIYESELVRASIDAKARHISKLKAEITGSAHISLQRTLSKAPNSWQTWSQFLYRLATILEVKNTAFIVPVISEVGETVGIYPIAPESWSLVEYGEERIPFIRFKFSDGNLSAIELSRVGILTKFQYKSDLFGTSNDALSNTMDLIQIQNQGIQEGVKSAASFRFMATLTNFSNDEDLVFERKRFSENNLKQGDGFLLWPNTYKDIQQINSTPFVVDFETMKLINTNVYNYFGVNEKILQNNATDEDMDAFFNGAIEPFSIQASEVISKMLFSARELSNGNRFYLNANRLQYMSVAHKVSMVQQLSDRGMMTANEARELFNYPPLDDESANKTFIRGEYYATDNKLGDANSEEETNKNE